MFNNVKSMLAGFNGNVSEQPLVEEQDMENSEMMNTEDMEPEEILDDPNASYEMKKMAMQRIKDRYLKPREDNNAE